MRLLSGHLQSAREEERIRIARELHDQIGQTLTATKMDLSLLQRDLTGKDRLPSPQQVCDDLESTKKLVDEAIDTMHAIVRELRPEVLDHLGLRDALEWQLQEFQSRTRIETEFTAGQEEIQLDTERAIAVFRIFQETLTNIARHAEAKQVRVLLSEQDRYLLLEVRDDGKGMDGSAMANPTAFGILGMRERAHVFGGDVVIVGEPGKGTVVSVRIPVEGRPAGAALEK